MIDTEQAVSGLVETWDDYTVMDLGPHLTCAEANALALLFEALGLDDLAVALIEGHSEDDDEGDLHYRGAA